MILKVSQAAADDLEGIWLYTVDRWSEEQADTYLNGILDVFDEIVHDPTIGKDFGQVREGYLGLKVGSHIVFYRLDHAANALEIIRVLHGRMDLENRLEP
ncbi:MAG: type II toxin-antitoxin system RelE/ParE family toxin [Flavobacteriales bacterium]|nr:type II toxin-antitoxin system RelE/ParE family toxin [Flavobacteriales bacterium]